ncbi:hypothetical protein OG455_19200 [Kitasatospora sp. NBC_01287]|uniref:DUF7144 family membrane protein n=1 Tax=Kitasatospora sp. NBC_01287 TaxID=2903573 RepID=UPI0022538231|nr:hypothetical protein [Kitasatospora sp. NBC_01287]MCX4747618.1 hypothetical protein [Kitasatospora sp. NBC_01287]
MSTGQYRDPQPDPERPSGTSSSSSSSSTSSSTSSSANRPGRPTGPPRGSGWADGGTMFAGVLMLVNGLLAVFQGIMGIAKDQVFVATPRYVFRFDLTSWGWIHLALGVLIALVGVGVLSGAGWARWTGVALTGLSLIAQFVFVPYYPLWSLVVIAIDVFIIWALVNYREEPGYRR